MPIATGSAGDIFGAIMATPGDLYTPAGSTSATVDLLVGESLTNEFFLLPGDPLAALDPGFGATAITMPDLVSVSFGTARHPSYGAVGDLDFDGEGELLAGTRTKEVVLWYADRFASAVSSNTVDRATATIFQLASAAASSTDFYVQFVGDFNGDGHPDLCVGDNHANTDQGQAVLLY
jgi:hypothetical protein